MVGTVSHVDLLIVGAGPAGLMAALWASRYNFTTRIIDSKPSRTQTGHADGLHSRTLEILDSFGLAEEFTAKACRINEICSWNPQHDDPERIIRTQRAMSQSRDYSRFSQLSIGQGTMEQIFLDYLAVNSDLVLERDTLLERLSIDDEACEDESAYPVKVQLRKQVGSTARVPDQEVVYAKYLVGCDGGRSTVRQQLGIQLDGERSRQHFGVMDIVPLTDFLLRDPLCAWQCDDSALGEPTARLYVQLGETPEGEHFDASKVTPQTILEIARKIMKPYSLDFRICDWQSVYTIQQRVATQFSCRDRVFLAGDAVHTHSPTMGQGMNVSMQDAYNLGWKIGSVLTGTAKREILSTYNTERRPVAQALIKLDKKMSSFYADGPSQESQDYQAFRDTFSRFLSGTFVTYEPSALVAASGQAPKMANGNADGHVGLPEREHTRSASEIRLGQRMPSHKVVCQAESNVVHLAQVLPSNGCWRVMVFTGDITSTSRFEAVQDLGANLETLAKQYARPKLVLEVLLIHSGTRDDVKLLDLHEVYHPWDDTLGWDYLKVFSDDADSLEPGIGSAYEKYGITEEAGCLVILRPDQHVSYIGTLEEYEAPLRFFERVLRPSIV